MCRAGWQKENSGNIKFYESFTQIATLLPINASPARSKVVATSAPSSHCLACPLLLPSPTPCNCFLFRFVCNFYIVAKCFRFNALIFILRTHKKVVCSPFNRPPPYSLPPTSFSYPPLPACCNPSQMLPSTAVAIVRCGSVAFIEYSLLFVFSTAVCVCVCVCKCVCEYVRHALRVLFGKIMNFYAHFIWLAPAASAK